MFYDRNNNSYDIGISPNVDNSKNLGLEGFPAGFKLPDFKSLFSVKELHVPDKHRNYVIRKGDYEKYHTKEKHDNYHIYKVNWNSVPTKVDRKKIELKAVYKDDKQFLAFTDATTLYLKKIDEDFVKFVYFQERQVKQEIEWFNSLPSYKQDRNRKEHNINLANYKANLKRANDMFKKFEADLARTFNELSNPILLKYKNPDGDFDSLPIEYGNFYAGELENYIKSIFGDVTKDTYIEAVNKDKYNNKIETTCCLQVCTDFNIYRQKGLPYEQSKDYKLDKEEEKKWRENNDFIPPKRKPLLIDNKNDIENKISKLKEYLRKINQVRTSPVNALLEYIQPFVMSAVDKHDWFVDYEYKGNEINIELDLSNIFN
ncbi:hypothetical protein CP960_13205 [Malaciobacter halophilus]|uniref:Uncharacterized protein n=1 Tax=Malaciobacter halophilus TaxID=197482 RepID=A0A2N1IZG4_9BACT|nr:hypothetical protein [Malaciobacter halophilus]AXH09730.1 hypothetical protein AHALO_1358 [Malaciobacter halophilus]AXH10060.1 hypothetical protein AHALO_1694 [Malaciobacter halophilus]PKI79693.1 hypothetical protein CP960_13205 [Malaciobacter halophilus]